MDVARALERVEAELERIGLLLEHDKLLPSATALIAGKPINGSWWGHALGHEIYAVLGELERGSGALCVKLVNGKRTYVHPRLYGAFFELLSRGRASATQACSALAGQLLALTERRGLLGLSATAPLASLEQCTAAARELEGWLLLHVGSEHSSSGKHEKRLESWSAWLGRHGLEVETQDSEQAREALLGALQRLGHGLVNPPKIRFLTE